MEKAAFDCKICQRKTHQNLSNRCQYCGAGLPEHMKMDSRTREAYLHELEDIEKESEAFARGMSSETPYQQEIKRKKRDTGEQKHKDRLSSVVLSTLPRN